MHLLRIRWAMRRGQGKRRSRTTGGTRTKRPSSDQLFAAAVDLVSSGSSAFKATARRYSLCVADADDAYQRGLEILITKAPTSERGELRPWLHTVVKHEALALRRQRERLLAGAGDPGLDPSGADSGPSPEEGAGQRERARRTAEALAQLKPSELRCLLLKALGYSYQEISARTGFSWTKVNRSLTEGRRRFFDRFAQIESGERCERFQPLLSAASDGEASSEDRRLLRAHLRGCQTCRAALRSYRAMPGHLTELLPPGLVLPLAQKEGWWTRLYESIVVGTTDRAGALGHKVQQAGELLSAQKATAVVASTAALAGGVAVQERHPDRRHAHGQAKPREAHVASAPAPREAVPPMPPPVSRMGSVETVAGGASPERHAGAGTGAPAGEFGPQQPAAPPQSGGQRRLPGTDASRESEEPSGGNAQAATGQEFAP